MSNAKIRILIAEDSAVQAEAIRRTLVAEGYSVIVAKDGADGLSKAKALKPELVVSDIMMPEMNGFELCKHIKADEGLRNTPVILLTSLSDPADVISGLECGADNFIIKPYEEKYLISRIRYMLLSREFQKDERTQMGVEIHFADRKYFITSEKKQILDLLISTYESAVQKNLQLAKAQEELQMLNEKLEERVKERTSSLAEEIAVRKKAEEKIIHLNLVLRAIRNINQLITRELDRTQLLQGACKSLVEKRGYRSAWIALLDESGKLISSAEARVGEQFSLMVRQLERGDLPECGLKARKESGVLVIDEKRVECHQCPLSDIYPDSPSMTMRLEYSSKIYGFITVSVPFEITMTEEEISLFQEVSGDIAFALHNLDVKADKKQAEEAKEKALHDLAERVKELSFLYTVTRLFVESDLSLEEMFQRIIDLIPPAFQYPDKTCARLILEEKEFKTNNFRESPWMHSADIIVSGEKAGSVQVYYLWEISENIKEPFLTEEQNLIKDLGAQLGIIVGHRRAEEAVRQSRKALAIRIRIATVFLTTPDNEMYNEVLKVVLEVMESKYGVFGYIDEDGAFVVPSMTRSIWDQCQVPEKSFVFPRDKWGHSSWVRAIKEKKTNYTNETSNLVPKGHIPILKHISVPIIYQGEVIGLLQVANKLTDYEQKDIQVLETIGEQIAPILNARLQRDMQEKHRKQAEEELQGEKNFIENALNSLPDVFFVFGVNGNFLRWNKTMNVVTGYDDAEISSMQPADFFLKEDRQRVMEAIEIAAREGYATVEARVVTKNGRNIPFEFTGSLLTDYEKKPLGVCGVGRDITERKQVEEKIKDYTENLEEKVSERTRELEDANLELQVLNKEIELRRQEAEDAKLQAVTASRAKSDFLANMSHELRTPLNSIIGFSEILQDELYGKLNEKQREYVSDVLGSGAHLLELINDILDLSKVESGKLELELSRFYLRDVLNTSMTMLREKAMKHNINLSLQIEPDADLEIEADERKLKQIMFNLLSNALKFTPDEGSVSVQARLIHDAGYMMQDASMIQDSRYKMQDKKETDDKNIMDRASCIVNHEIDLIEISVEDTGIGIKPEDIPKLFKEFSQIESAYTKTYEGTGLGLALTKRLVELFGGRIWVGSEFGKGSKFTFVIPVKHDA